MLVFYAQYLWHSGNSGWQRCSHVILGNQLRSLFCFYGHQWGEPCLTQVSNWLSYNNLKCALRLRRKLCTQSTPKFRKATMARYEFGTKYALKINHFIFAQIIVSRTVLIGFKDMGYPRSRIFKNCPIKVTVKVAFQGGQILTYNILTPRLEILLWLLLTFQSSNVGKFA